MSIETLPTEIFHRIFDQLDTKDIHFSCRFVCKRFYAMANSYDRLKIELTYQASKSKIRQIFRMVQPENIVQLTVQNSYFHSNVVESFLSCIYLHRLTRIRSMTLCDIGNYNLQTLITPLLTSSTLTSVTVRINMLNIWSNGLVSVFEQIISLPNIRCLTLDIPINIIEQLTWPSSNTLETLKLRACSYEQLCSIFDKSLNLQTLTLSKDALQDTVTTLRPISFQSLTSLKLERVQMSINELEFFLSLQPSLISLFLTIKSLCSWEFFEQFSHWEAFIRNTLPKLKKFDFYVCTEVAKYPSIESILLPFCTPFWLQEKRWFVSCQCTNHFWRKTLAIYSSTYQIKEFPDNINACQMSYAITTANYENRMNRNIMWSARINLSQMISAINRNKFKLPFPEMGRTITRFALEITEGWSINEAKTLSKCIDLSQIRELWLIETSYGQLEPDKIKSLLVETSNICTLGLFIDNNFRSKVISLVSIVSGRINHLILNMTNMDNAKFVCKHVRNIATITFQQHNNDSNVMSNLIEWLVKKGKYFIVNNERKCIQIQQDIHIRDLSCVKQNRKRKRST